MDTCELIGHIQHVRSTTNLIVKVGYFFVTYRI